MKISVVMPAFNAERYVAAAIESILSQTYGDFEFVIVNDGSTDRTLDIIKGYAERDPRFRVITQDNQGISSALNRGIQETRYEWIAVMHADDVSMSNRLEKQLQAALNKPNVVAWGSYAYYISEKGKELGLSRIGPTTETEFFDLLQRGKPVQIIHSTSLMRKEAVLKVGGYDPDYVTCEDLEFFQRLSQLGPILAIPEPLGQYRIHGENNSTEYFFLQCTYLRFLEKRQQALSKGDIPSTLNEFMHDYNAVPYLIRLRRRIEDLSRFYYRKFAVMVSNEKYVRGILYFLFSSMLDPTYSLPRAWRQRFEMKTRQMLNPGRG